MRESMSLDLLDRLISDICAITQVLLESDPVDLAAFQPGATTVEKQHQSKGVDGKGKLQNGTTHPMSKGIHRSVC